MEDLSIFKRALDLLQGLPPEYKLSGIAITLLFFVAWRLFTSKALVSALDRLFQSRIEEANLYRLLRLSLSLGTFFSVVVIVLAFAAPLLQGLIDNFRISSVLAANAELKARNYPQARGLYMRALSNAPDEATAEQIQGLITATYYGQGLHREGLDYICGLYAKRGPGDFRYLFAVQAHLRALRKQAANDNPAEAEELAAALRQKCGRPDFSEIWASIPFGMMEELRKGDLMVDHPYRLSPVDRARLTSWVEQKSRETSLRLFPFGDYALYFLGEWDRALLEYPKSPIRDVILLDAGAAAKWPNNATYLTQFASEYPQDRRLVQAYIWLVGIYTENGKRDLALEAAKRVGELGEDVPLWRILTPALDAARKLASAGDFGAAHKTLVQVCETIAAHRLECPADVQKERDLFSSIALRIAQTTDPNDCGRLSNEIRQAHWTLGARAYLDACLPRVDVASEEYGRDIYRLASQSRKVGDYGTSLKYLQRFVLEITDHPLLDDVHVEIAWHYILIEPNWPMAQYELQTVVQRFPNRNAYDNALWWLAIGAKRNGEYPEATARFLQIAALDVQSRFQKWASSEAQAIAQMKEFAPLSGPAFINDPRNPYSGLLAMRVTAGSEAHLLGVRAGDRLTRVCGNSVSSVNDMLGAASHALGTQECEIIFTRGNDRVVYVGSGALRQGWRASLARGNQWQPSVAPPSLPPPAPPPVLPPPSPTFAPPSDTASPSNSGLGPSYSCTGRLTLVERAICVDTDLSAKDRELAGLYRTLKAGLAGNDVRELAASENVWWRQREACREPELKTCISQSYDERIRELKRRLGIVSGTTRQPGDASASVASSSSTEGAAGSRTQPAVPTETHESPHNATHCLNAISLAQTRYHADWRSMIDAKDRVDCAAEIRQAGN